MSTIFQSQQTDTEIKLTDIISVSFYKLHWDILEGKHTYYELAGGRGSTKSSVASVEIVLGMMDDPLAHAMVFRKVASTLRESVYEQIQWAIEALGVSDYWDCGVNPMQCTYKKTGQRIIFRGLDKAKKRKSVKFKRGYIKYLWFEELDEFNGEAEIRNVQQSAVRGNPEGTKFVIFKSFNPPINRSNWANMSFETAKKNTFKHRSTYLDVDPKWLGSQFIEDAETLRETNEKAYRHEYLGEPVGTGTTIFEDIEIIELSDEKAKSYEYIYQGQDWGWYPDAKAFVRLSYDKKTEVVTILEELGGLRIKNIDLAKEIQEKNFDDFPIYCGQERPENINDYKDAGLHALGAWMSSSSVKYTHEWLQCRKIQIDPNRTPCLYKEISMYEHDVDGNGDVISAYPQKNNHYIDAMRYAISHISKRRGESA